MKPEQLRNLINLFEDRLPDVEYQDSEKEVVAVLRSYNSQVYTKLAQKIERIDLLEAEIKQLKAEVKDETKGLIAGLFDAVDAARTRVVKTVSFIFKLTKDPAATEAPKYKEILTALEAHLTPELLTILEGLKKQLVTVTQKSPALSIRPNDELNEGVADIFAKVKRHVFQWAVGYDRKLAQLEAQAGVQ